jgi:response regulator of citrate/malate metabolism
MSDGLNVVILDDDPPICRVIEKYVKEFYTWGEVVSFSDDDAALAYCLERKIGVAIFIVDVFLNNRSGFSFLDEVEKRFPSAHQDAIIITGSANDDVVNMCVASGVHYLLEKPVKKYALQLAVRSIINKYIRFSKMLLQNGDYARLVANIQKAEQDRNFIP